MGSGKSTVATILAARLRVEAVDLDHLIEARAGASVETIFAREGELGFRRLEGEALERIEGVDLVVALGGGAVTERATRHRLLDEGLLITLTAPLETLVKRASESARGRPLLGGSPVQALRRILEARAGAYAECHASLSTEGLTPNEVAEAVAEVARDAPVVVPLGERTYRVEIGRGVRTRLKDRVFEAAEGGVVLVSDGDAERPWPREAAEALSSAGRPPVEVRLEAGEVHKNIGTVERIWDAALDAGVDRRAIVVGVGGGVVGDLAGFAASTLLRGVALGQLPTTLLSMVDSSVGGKTGFNRAHGKNLVGTFYQPSFVLCDVETLSTLPDEDRRAGLAEVVKSAWIDGDASVAMLERDADALADGDADATIRAVRMSVRLKSRIVREDEREAGTRMLLNLGHTIGHCLEAADNYRGVRHGEGVALGMVAALRVGAATGHASAQSTLRLERLLERMKLPVDLDRRLDERVLSFLSADKKMRGEKVRFVIPGEPGETRIESMTLADVKRAVWR